MGSQSTADSSVGVPANSAGGSEPTYNQAVAVEFTMSSKPIEGYREVQFKDGGSFRGAWQNGVPHGFGTSTDPSGAEYIGTFQEGIPHGRGSHVWPNAERYEGDYQQGKQHGYGRWVHPSGDAYEGFWAADVRHGLGVYRTSKGQAWFGEWRGGKQYKSLNDQPDSIRPPWAACFGRNERLYETALYDHNGIYHGASPGYDIVEPFQAATYDVVSGAGAAASGGASDTYDVVAQKQRPSQGASEPSYDVVAKRPGGVDVVAKPVEAGYLQFVDEAQADSDQEKDDLLDNDMYLKVSRSMKKKK